MLRILCLLLMFSLPAQAEEVVAGLSQNRISIDTNFDGSEILIFGAVKRETPIPSDQPLEVIIAVAGPSIPVTVREKQRRAGIWVNANALHIDRAPVFYAVATSGIWENSISLEQDFQYRVSLDRAIRVDGAASDGSDSEEFTEALIRIREDQGAYQTLIGAIALSEETLFRTSIALPANLTEGDYATRIFLTRNGEVIDLYETSIFVRKVGMERFLYNLAQDQALIYGLMSLAIAIAAGWGASAVFRYFRA